MIEYTVSIDYARVPRIKSHVIGPLKKGILIENTNVNLNDSKFG